MCVTHDGVLFAWGSGGLGQLGLDDCHDLTLPTHVPSSSLLGNQVCRSFIFLLLDILECECIHISFCLGAYSLSMSVAVTFSSVLTMRGYLAQSSADVTRDMTSSITDIYFLCTSLCLGVQTHR